MPSDRVVLYSDFNCPFCYALHERLHEMGLIEFCEWRGVQHAPHLPRPMRPWQGSLGAELTHEVAVVQRLAPNLPIIVPSGKPNTLPAIELAVALLQKDPRGGMEFVRRTYRAFWCDGQDISDSAVLTQLTGEQSVEDVGSQYQVAAQKWETAWHATGQNGVPLLVSPDGDLLVGCVPAEQVRQFFSTLSTNSPHIG
ncbi:MAG: DsbA family protein [Nitrospira sp.]|nr:DsbA family protein [Nitrospira sp.]MDH4304958.1 DsbA family protein [Nitrospira sp.]MDH5193558.1 DsbA family protein [Nitrospira sp.]